MCASLQHHRKHQLPFPTQTLISRPEVTTSQRPTFPWWSRRLGRQVTGKNRIRRKWVFAVCCSIFFFCSWLFWLKKGWKESTGWPGRVRKGDGTLLLTPKDFLTDSCWWDQQEQIVYKWKKNKRSWKSPELGRVNYRWKPLKQNSHIKTIWNSKELFLFPLLKLKALCCKSCYNVMLDFNKDFKTVHIFSGFCLTFRNDTFHTYMKALIPYKKWILPQIRLEFNYNDSEEKPITVSLDLGSEMTGADTSWELSLTLRPGVDSVGATQARFTGGKHGVIKATIPGTAVSRMARFIFFFP